MVSALMKHSLRAGDKAIISAGTEVPWDTPSSPPQRQGLSLTNDKN